MTLRQATAFLVAVKSLTLLVGMPVARAAEDPFVQHQKLMNEAINKRDLFKVKALLSTPYVNPDGYEGPHQRHISYLTRAVRSSADILEALLSAGAHTPQWRPAACGTSAVLLIEAIASLGVPTPFEVTPDGLKLNAAGIEQRRKVQLLLKSGIEQPYLNSIDKCTDYQATPLPGQMGATPLLQLAATGGSPDIAIWLIEAGGDLTVADLRGRNFYHYLFAGAALNRGVELPLMGAIDTYLTCRGDEQARSICETVGVVAPGEVELRPDLVEQRRKALTAANGAGWRPSQMLRLRMANNYGSAQWMCTCEQSTNQKAIEALLPQAFAFPAPTCPPPYHLVKCD